MKKIKKIISFFLIFAMLFVGAVTLVSCKKEGDGNGDDGEKTGEPEADKTGIVVISDSTRQKEVFLGDKGFNFSIGAMKAYEVKELRYEKKYCALIYLQDESFASGVLKLGINHNKPYSEVEVTDIHMGSSKDSATVFEDNYNASEIWYKIHNTGYKGKMRLYIAVSFTVSNADNEELPISFEYTDEDGGTKTITYEKPLRYEKQATLVSSIKFLTEEGYTSQNYEQNMLEVVDMQIGKKYFAVIDFSFTEQTKTVDTDIAKIDIMRYFPNKNDVADVEIKLEAFPTSSAGENVNAGLVAGSFRFYSSEAKTFRFIISIVPKSGGSFGISAYLYGEQISFIGDNISKELNLDGDNQADSKLEYVLSTNKDYYIVTGVGEERGDSIIVPAVYSGLPVKEIADNAFAYSTHIKKLILPSSIEKIGASAFRGTQINNITIPENIQEIGSLAFADCVSTDIYCETDSKPMKWNEGWVSSGTAVTWDCRKLLFTLSRDNSYYILDTSNSCFSETVAVPDFYNDLPVAAISDNALRGLTSLKTLKIGDNVKTIGSYAFADCTNLKNVVLPAVLESIGDYAFKGCTVLDALTIPASVNAVGENAFLDCSSLITYDGNVGYVDKWAIYASTALSSVSFRADTVGVAASTFKNHTLLTEITLPSSVKYINTSAFSGCTALAALNFSEGLEVICKEAFRGCTGLAALNFSEGLEVICKEAFRGCTGLIRVTTPNSLKTIESDAFTDCRHLSSFVIGSGVESLGAFENCFSLVEVYNLSDEITVESGRRDSHVGTYAIVVNTDITVPSRVSLSGDYIIYRDGEEIILVGYKGAETVLTLPETIDGSGYRIKGSAFRDNTALTEISVPLTVTEIGSAAFNGCTALEKMTLPFVGRNGSLSWDSNFGYIFGVSFYMDNVLAVPTSLKTVVLLTDSYHSTAFYGLHWIDVITPADMEE